MLRTEICDLFGIDYPLVQGGMIWNSGADLAAAVSEAGALGLVGAGSMTPDLLEAQIRKAKRLTEKPFGVNLPVFYKHADENLEVMLREKVGIVFTSGGSPKRFTARLKDRGVKVAHVVARPDLARKCEEAGVDAVVCEGFEAGGHNGRDELTTMALVPQCVDAVRIPVLAAGGIGDGRAMAAALALGAKGVQVGTRFAATFEASGHPAFKQAVLDAGCADTVLCMRRLMPVRLIRNAFAERMLEAEARGATREELSEMLGRGRAKAGMLDGDAAEGELEIGQVSGLIRELKPAGEVVREMVAECERVLRGLYGAL